MTADIHSLPNRDKPLVEHAMRYARAGVKIFATTESGKAPSTSNAAWSEFLGREVRKGEGGCSRGLRPEALACPAARSMA